MPGDTGPISRVHCLQLTIKVLSSVHQASRVPWVEEANTFIGWLGVRRDPPRNEREESMEPPAEAGKGTADLKRVYMPSAFVDVLCNPPPSQFPLPFSPLFSPAFLLSSRDCTQASCEAGYFSPTEPQYPQHLPHGVNWNHLLVRGFSRVGH